MIHLFRNIDHVLVTGDILRPFPAGDGLWESATEKNINWAFRVMRHAMSSFGLPIQRFMWTEHTHVDAGHRFDTPAFYAALGLEVNLSSWARARSAPAATQALASTLSEVTRNALVMGYEMPPAMTDALDGLGVPYIDIALHPIRFLPDLVFGFRSNRNAIRNFFHAQALDPGTIQRSAALIAAKVAWLPLPRIERIPGTLLVLGQVSTDASLSRPNGSFLALPDFRDRLVQLSFDYPQILYKPHPYEAGQESTRKLLAEFPSFRLVNDNFYQLLAQEEICGVVAINSSGLAEAPCFGCEAIGLSSPLYTFDDGDAGHTGIDNRWLDPHFWAALHEGHELTPDLQPPNTLRKSMNADWGFGQLDQVHA